jgi:16S rRNA (cytidine1402-2'-O)-methyltransferase
MSKLYLVPTPIGNLEDITLRAIRTLKEVDLILAEDTRKTKILLTRYQIETPSRSYHAFNEHKTTSRIVEQIASGQVIALVTDAGTPGISDPGFLLVRACIEASIPIECLPGATAFVPALVNSGIPSSTFCFEGFLPPKKGRQKKLQQLALEARTLILYESPHRLIRLLEELIQYFGPDRYACVCRELTKIHEENQRGTIRELVDCYKDKTTKGEIVVVIAGAGAKIATSKDEEVEPVF